VVCSAFTPRSKWVEREIQIFNELGRGDQVLALLTEGEPGDSFPDVMLVRHREVIDPDGSKRIVKEDKEPLAADVRPRRGISTDTLKRLALLRLVAVILGVKFDDLRQRDQEREHKRHVTWAAIAAALVLLVGGMGGLYWDMIRPKTAFFRQLVWRWGIPEGVDKIDAETHGHLGRSYSVVTQRSKVVEVIHDGWIRAEADGFHRWVVHYGDDGSAQKIEIFDATRRLVREEVLRREASGNKMVVSFERGNVPLAQSATQNLIIDPANTSPAPDQPKSEITRHELTFDHNGFTTEVRYQDNWGTPVHDGQGSFGEHFSYSPQGLVQRSTEIGPNGEDITLRSGVHAVESSYDNDTRLVRLTLLGEDGRPIDGPDGYAYYQRDYDSRGNGNDTTQTYFAADGKQALSRNGYSKLVGYFDEHGNNIELAFFGTDGKLAPHKDGFASIKRKFDDRGNLVEMAFFDVNNQPTYDNLGRAGVWQKYNERGNIVDVEYYGTDGKPTISKQGFAIMRQAFDDRGRAIDTQTFGLDGMPKATQEGIARSVHVFDTRGNEIERKFFGVDGNATLGTIGYASVRRIFDDRGNIIETAYFGLDGKPTLAALGFAVIRQAFDDRHHRIELSYFGPDGKPILSSEHIARVTYAYDDYGNEIERAFFGADGKRLLSMGGFAGFRTAYDARGNKIETSYFGVNGEPTQRQDGGYAKITWAYNTRGNLVEESYFGVDGKPAHNDGCVTIRYFYDDQGQQTKVSYLDAEAHELQMELVIRGLIPGGAAARAGFAVGDHILTYNGAKVGSVKQLSDLTGGIISFRTVTLRRGSQIITLQVIAGSLDIYLGLARVDT
jgi:hypothetical protein